jgi:hypothetical protein
MHLFFVDVSLLPLIGSSGNWILYYFLNVHISYNVKLLYRNNSVFKQVSIFLSLVSFCSLICGRQIRVHVGTIRSLINHFASMRKRGELRIERSGRMVGTPASSSGGPGFKCLP